DRFAPRSPPTAVRCVSRRRPPSIVLSGLEGTYAVPLTGPAIYSSRETRPSGGTGCRLAWEAIANRSQPLSADAEARQEPILRRRTRGPRPPQASGTPSADASCHVTPSPPYASATPTAWTPCSTWSTTSPVPTAGDGGPLWGDRSP